MSEIKGNLNLGLKQLYVLSSLKCGKYISLREVSKIPRKKTSSVGTSSWRFGEELYDLPKGKAIYKTYDTSTPRGSLIRKLRIINEILVSEFARQINLESAIYEPAVLDDSDGLVTYDFLKKNEGFVYTKDSRLKYKKFKLKEFASIEEYLKNLKNNGYKLNETEIEESMFKTLVLDLLTLQTDRTISNMPLILNRKTKEVRFSPIFDNEYAFNVFSFYSGTFNGIFEMFYNSGRPKFDKIINVFNYYTSNKRGNPYLAINTNNEAYDINFFQVRVKSLVEMARANPRLFNILTQILNSIDSNQVFENIQNEFDLKVSLLYKNFVKEIICGCKKYFLKEIENQKNKQKI